jgi:hypothetical protein
MLAIRMEQRPARIAFAGVALALALVSLGLALRGNVERQSFKAFYCAGTAVRERADPYRVEPLRSCERRFEPTPIANGYVEPAPLPGYVLAFFALLSLLPPKAAATAFALLLAAAAAGAARALAAIVPAPSWAVLLAFVPLTLLNVAYGELPPLATLAICAAGYLLVKERFSAAGVAVALALIQPNVGLPAALAVLLFVPRARVAIVATGAALAALSFVALGFAANVEYLARVLPLIANAEIVASDQYSLSHLLYMLGVSTGSALLAGKIWFACAAAAGIVLAGRSSRRELLALLPPAAVTLFGIYLHDIQVLIAIPAALALAARVRGAAGAVATACAILLVVVWTQPARPVVLLIDAAGAFGAVLAIAVANQRRIALAFAAAAATIVAVVGVQHASPESVRLVTRPFDATPNELSPIAWGRYLRATPAMLRPVIAPQLLTWLGLIGLFACALGAPANGIMRGRSVSREPLPATAQCSGSSQRCD